MGGADYQIRTDFRIILGVLKYFQDKELDIKEKWAIALKAIYKEFDKIPEKYHEEAILRAREFIDAGVEEEDSKKPSLVNWEHDAGIIIPAINKVAGTEVRSLENVHWWTFIGWYMERGEGSFNTVVSIRSKRSKGKKLEKWEKEFFNEHKSMVLLEQEGRSEEERQALRELTGV